MLHASLIGQKMPLRRFPVRDPRTVARDIPGVMDVLFPRLSGGLVASLNRDLFAFEGVEPIPETLIDRSTVQKALLFEISSVYAEAIIQGEDEPSWSECFEKAWARQRAHFDAKRPRLVSNADYEIVQLATNNLVSMLRSIKIQSRNTDLQIGPEIPGMGWIASGVGDFAIGSLLIEVKHTDRNFVSRDFRQVLMYWLLKYADAIEKDEVVWSEILLLNPRRNAALLLSVDKVLASASDSQNRIELLGRLRSLLDFQMNRT